MSTPPLAPRSKKPHRHELERRPLARTVVNKNGKMAKHGRRRFQKLFTQLKGGLLAKGAWRTNDIQ